MRARGIVPRHLFLLLLSLAFIACMPLAIIQPTENVWVLQGEAWEPLKHPRLLSADSQTESSFLMEHAKPEVCIVNVAEVGVSAEHFFYEERGGVGRWLWRNGFSVLSIGIPKTALASSGWREKTVDHLSPVLQGYRERCRGVPKVGIGHGIGGSILLAPEVNAYFDGVVFISVPLTYAGTSVATQTLLNASSDWSWRDLVGFAVPINFAGSTSMEEVVVTNRNTTAERFEFYRVESSRLPRAFRQDIAKQVSKVTDLRIAPEVKSWLYSTQPALVVLPSGNGWISSWQADPIALGAPASRAKRIYITRSNGSTREFNHFDVFWDEDALNQVWRPVAQWLRETSF